MAKLDPVIDRLIKEGGKELLFETGSGAVLRKEGADVPVIRAALSTSQIVGAFLEVAPPELRRGIPAGATEFPYASPAGLVRVQIVSSGDKIRVRVTQAVGGDEQGARPGPEAPAGPPAAPAARPLAAGAPASGRPGPPVVPAGPRAAEPATRPPVPQVPAEAAPSVQAPPALAAPAPAPLPSAPSGAPRALGTDPAKALRSLLQEALGNGASDLHLVSGRPPLFRIACELNPSGEPLSPELVSAMGRAAVPERLWPTLERDGSCDFALAFGDLGRFRVNVSRQRTGLKVCVRLIPGAIPTLATLGLPEAISHATHHHQGLIIVTGPSGHGKTSTLAAIVDIINTTSTHHVITVEDPIEYLHPIKKAMMSQREVGTHTRSFQSALKGSLREDPDVIVVGELRDTETMRMALQAGETGHLMIATMNTPSAAKTIDRMIDLFPPGDQQQVRMSLAGGLRLIVSQRLIPSLDRKGVVVAAELLPGSTGLSNLIRDEKTFQIPSLQQRGKSLGIVRMDDSLAELVVAGKTSLEIAQQFAESPGELTHAVRQLQTAKSPAPPAPDPKRTGFAKVSGLLGRKG